MKNRFPNCINVRCAIRLHEETAQYLHPEIKYVFGGNTFMLGNVSVDLHITRCTEHACLFSFSAKKEIAERSVINIS